MFILRPKHNYGILRWRPVYPVTYIFILIPSGSLPLVDMYTRIQNQYKITLPTWTFSHKKRSSHSGIHLWRVTYTYNIRIPIRAVNLWTKKPLRCSYWILTRGSKRMKIFWWNLEFYVFCWIAVMNQLEQNIKFDVWWLILCVDIRYVVKAVSCSSVIDCMRITGSRFWRLIKRLER